MSQERSRINQEKIESICRKLFSSKWLTTSDVKKIVGTDYKYYVIEIRKRFRDLGLDLVIITDEQEDQDYYIPVILMEVAAGDIETLGVLAIFTEICSRKKELAESEMSQIFIQNKTKIRNLIQNNFIWSRNVNGVEYYRPSPLAKAILKDILPDLTKIIAEQTF